MMRSVVQLVLAVLLLVAAGPVAVAVCEVVNGSFEENGYIANVGQAEPNDWTAAVSPDRFAGYVDTDWPTDGVYNLTLHSLYAKFDTGDMATVSQAVDLSIADEIVFDVKLRAERSAWDPNICSAVVLIDGEVVWTSDEQVPNDEGELIDQRYQVESQYRTAGPHEVSLGLRVNKAGWLWERYYTDWDFVALTLLCGGGGFLPGDFNGDCFVDVDDLTTMAVMWLADVPADSPYNLSAIDEDGTDGTVNNFDFAVFGANWLGSSLVQTQ